MKSHEDETLNRLDEVADEKRLYTSGIAATPLYEGSTLTTLQSLVNYFPGFVSIQLSAKLHCLPCLLSNKACSYLAIIYQCHMKQH